MPGLNSTRAEAAERSSHLVIQSYQVTLDLSVGDEVFESKTIVKFTCNKAGYETFIDAVGKNVIKATLNGQVVDTANYDGESIFIKNLATENELVIHMNGFTQKLVKVCNAQLIQLIMRFISTPKVRLHLLERCIPALINQI